MSIKTNASGYDMCRQPGSRPLEIVQYPYPTLRHKSKPVRRVDKELRKMVDEMFELMFASKGVGLAANQVDLPVRLFLLNEAGNPDEAESHVFINPIVTRPKGSEEKEEGCLSFPELYAPVKRPASVHVSAYNLKGEEFEGEVDGLFGRIVQHETDHLDGVLFIDRLSTTATMQVKEEVETFERQFASMQERGEIPEDDAIAKRVAELEDRYC